ncbi:signal transduction histidine kinase [Burkholderiales bacterium JOSHI_001]|nr:signal transduction histidine kinase [Burkholderiales bacterium JOSHI_001]
MGWDHRTLRLVGVSASALAWLLRRMPVPLLALGLAALVAQQAAAEPNYHFPSQRPGAAITLNPGVLSAEERAFVAALPEIRVAVPLPPSRPYEEVAADGTVSGIHPEFLGYLAQAFGLKLRPVVFKDWSSVLQAARKREVDLLMTLGPTAERMEYLAFTLGATPLQGALFARKGGQTPVHPADLDQARFVLERNYMANDHVRRQYPLASILTVETTGEALAAVGDKRADYYLGSLFEGIAWQNRQPVSDVEVRQLMDYGSGHYHFAVRKDWAPLAGVLNKGIAGLRDVARPEWSAALQDLPQGVQLRPSLNLSDTERSALLARPHWRVGAVRGLAMLNEVDAQGVHSGIAAEYMEQVARRLGVSVQVVPFDSVAAMLDGMRSGVVDMVPFLTRTPEREKVFAYSTPYVSMPYNIVARSDAPLYWDLNSLRGRTLALAAQHPLRELLAQRYPDIRIHTTTDGGRAMDAVLRAEADAAVEVKLFANLRINSDSDGRLRAVAELDELPAQFHFAVLHSNAALLPLVDRALADVPANERERMLRRWVALDLKPGFHWQRYLPALGVAAGALLLLGSLTFFWMRRLSREVRARRISEAQLHDIGSALPGVSFRHVLNAQGALVSSWYSPGAAAFLGIELDPKFNILTNIAPRVRAADLAEAQVALQNSLQTGQRFKMTGAYAHPDGRERWLHAEAVLTPAGSSHQAWTGYVVDVSTERELQARLAKEAQARNLLLASASHELRAPTHTLSLALQALPGDAVAPPHQASLRIAQDSARTLAQLLNDVLDAARFDSGELRLRPQDFDLHALVQQVADGFRNEAAAKGLDFKLQLDSQVPALVHGDPLRLKQLLINLLSNAVKYTPSGQIGLAVQLSLQAQGAQLRFVVSDTGVGIPSALRERLFQPYATGEHGLSAVPQGSSGLGLAICQRLCTLMGGELDLHSAPGQGTTVTLSLPLPAADSTPMPSPGGPVQAAALGTVLVCDDDPTSRMLLSHMLRHRGLQVEAVANAQSALARWRAGGVGAVVTDIDMDGMDGLELIRTLRLEERHDERQALGRTRLIVCSGSPVPAQEVSNAATDYDRFLTKPVRLELLLQALHSPPP